MSLAPALETGPDRSRQEELRQERSPRSSQLLRKLRCSSGDDYFAIHFNDRCRKCLHSVLFANPTVHIQPKLEIKRVSSKLSQIPPYLRRIPNKDSFDLVFPT